MFKSSTTGAQLNFFGSFDFNLDDSRVKALNDPNSWFNQFFDHVTQSLEESHFSVLYSDKMGRSNASIRVLLAMMALKSGFGWSDAQLFEQAQFNVLVMKALGFVNLGDKIPAASTYYLFKQLVYEYQVEHGCDLIEESFRKLTKTQIEVLGIEGGKIRMDSKLIGSNIVKCSRLQLILSCVREFWISLPQERQEQLDESSRSTLRDLCNKKPHNIVYTMTEEEKSQKLLDLGVLLLQLQKLYDDSDGPKYHLINRLLDEQYQMVLDKIELKPAKEVATDSIQSPHDTDAAYRKKKDQTVRGYSINVTETCNDEGPNLVTDVQVEKANKADNDFVQPAMENLQEMLGNIDEVYMDGAYNSQSNLKFAEAEEIQMYFTGIQGAKGNFEFKLTDQGLQVFNRKTGEMIDAIQYKDDHYKIKLSNGKWRYFKPTDIEAYHRRRAIEDLPKEISNKRNNVEATIFQLSFHTRNNKTRYRGQFRNKVAIISRAIWMNMIRIKNFMEKATESVEVART